MKKVLVTGITGLVGSHVALLLDNKGYEIHGIKRNSSNTGVFDQYLNHPSLANKIHWHKGDLLDAQFCRNLVKQVDVIVHCAAIVSFDSKDKTSIVKDNVQVTANIVNAALEFKTTKLVYVSSVGALGRSSNGFIDETTNWNPALQSSAYGLSKHLAELEVWRAEKEGLHTAIVNPSIILGPGPWSNTSTKIFKQVHNGLKYYSTGSNGFVDVRDVAQAMIMLLESNIHGERYVINGYNLSYKELFDKISKAFLLKPPYIKVSPFLANVVWRLEWLKSKLTGSKPLVTKETAHTASQTYCYSSDKFKSTFNFSFNSIDNTIQYTVECLKKNC